MMNRLGNAKGTVLAALLALGSVASGSAPAFAGTPDLYFYTVGVGDEQATADAVISGGPVDLGRCPECRRRRGREADGNRGSAFKHPCGRCTH
jgi:hypothetical protein